MPKIRTNQNHFEIATNKQLEYIDQLFIDILGEDWLNPVKRKGLVNWALGYTKAPHDLAINEASKVIDYLKGVKEQKNG